METNHLHSVPANKAHDIPSPPTTPPLSLTPPFPPQDVGAQSQLILQRHALKITRVGWSRVDRELPYSMDQRRLLPAGSRGISS